SVTFFLYPILLLYLLPLLFFFYDPATPPIYPLSLPDALPILPACCWSGTVRCRRARIPTISRISTRWPEAIPRGSSSTATSIGGDRKSTRLNSSHVKISYAVFCLKKKKKKNKKINNNKTT